MGIDLGRSHHLGRRQERRKWQMKGWSFVGLKTLEGLFLHF